MDTMHRRYRRRLMATAMAAMAAVLAVLCFLASFFGKRDIQRQLESGARSVAVSVAQLLMADMDGYRAFIESKDTGGPYYRRMQRHLAAIRDESRVVRYIYTERRLDKDTTEYILDAEPPDSEDYSPPGKLEDMDPEKDLVFAKKVRAASNVTNDDKWGWLITSYVPILDEGGEVLGLVGVDIEGRHMDRQFKRIRAAMIVSSLVILGLFFVSLLGFADAVLGCLFTDRVTGAFTRRHFERELGSRLLHSAKHRQMLALMMVEPDFEAAADATGPTLRNRVLAHVSGAMKDHIRPDDCLARYGDKGLALIVADTGVTNIADVAERLRQAIEGSPMPVEGGDGHVRVAVSIGVAVGGGPSQSAEELVGSAERALAQAKAAGTPVAVSRAGGGEAG